VNRLLVLSVSFIITLIFIMFNKNIKRGGNSKVHGGYYLIIVLVILISTLIINTLFHYCSTNIFCIISVIGLLIVNMLVLYLFCNMIEKFRLAEVNVQLLRQMEYQDTTYDKTTNSFKDIKRVIHDTNKHLLFIDRCIKEGRLHEASGYIHLTLDKIDISYLRVNTGNLVIDALVSNILNIAQDNGVRVKYKFNLLDKNLKIETYDLCVLLGNILDNAVEAAILSGQTDDKYVEINIFSNEYTLFMNVINTMKDYTCSFRTKKQGPDFHGNGLANIRRVTEKYDGNIRIEAMNHRFNIMVSLQLLE
jgi:two-component system sensor histidine kinase AgrC